MGARQAIIRQKLLPPKLYLSIVVNFDSLYGINCCYAISFFPYFWVFSVNAAITCLNVNNDLLISIASFINVWFNGAPSWLVWLYRSLPAKSTSCSFDTKQDSTFFTSYYWTVNVRIQWDLLELLFIQWLAIILFLSPFKKYFNASLASWHSKTKTFSTVTSSVTGLCLSLSPCWILFLSTFCCEFRRSKIFSW